MTAPAQPRLPRLGWALYKTRRRGLGAWVDLREAGGWKLARRPDSIPRGFQRLDLRAQHSAQAATAWIQPQGAVLTNWGLLRINRHTIAEWIHEAAFRQWGRDPANSSRG